jgi:hypothetical protein
LIAEAILRDGLLRTRRELLLLHDNLQISKCMPESVHCAVMVRSCLTD